MKEKIPYRDVYALFANVLPYLLHFEEPKQFECICETKSIHPICLFGFLLYLVCLNSGRKFVFILSFTSLNNYCRLPFRSGGLCGRLLIAKLSKSLMLGPSNFSATDCVVVVVKFRLIDRCCRRLC